MFAKYLNLKFHQISIFQILTKLIMNLGQIKKRVSFVV